MQHCSAPNTAKLFPASSISAIVCLHRHPDHDFNLLIGRQLTGFHGPTSRWPSKISRKTRCVDGGTPADLSSTDCVFALLVMGFTAARPISPQAPTPRVTATIARPVAFSGPPPNPSVSNNRRDRPPQPFVNNESLASMAGVCLADVKPGARWAGHDPYRLQPPALPCHR